MQPSDRNKMFRAAAQKRLDDLLGKIEANGASCGQYAIKVHVKDGVPVVLDIETSTKFLLKEESQQ